MAHKITMNDGRTYPSYTELRQSGPGLTPFPQLLRHYFCRICHHELDREKIEVRPQLANNSIMRINITIQPQACPRCPIVLHFSVTKDGALIDGS